MYSKFYSQEYLIRHVLIIFAVLILLFSFTGGVNAFGGGSGTSSDPFVIQNQAHLTAINGNLGSHFILGNDIHLTGQWVPIGTAGNPFTGSLDGNGHTIHYLTVNQPSNNYVGLFAVTSGAFITHLTIESASVSGFSNVGIIAGHAADTIIDGITVAGNAFGSYVGDDGAFGLVVGRMTGGEISNTHAAGNIGGYMNVGGLVGFMNNGLISDSSASGSVSGRASGGLVGFMQDSSITGSSATGNIEGFTLVGGLVGSMTLSEISYSYATGSIVGTEGRAGGLVGQTNDNSVISNSHATGNVAGNAIVGGLVGELINSEISGSYAAGNVFGTSMIGGLVGQTNFNSYITGSFAAGNVSGVMTVGGLAGLLQISTIQNSFATGNVDGSMFTVGGLVGSSIDSQVINSMALNEFVNGTIRTHRDFGLTRDTVSSNVFVWSNLSGTNSLSTTQTVTSLQVWNSYPSAFWTNLGFTQNHWVLNNHNQFLLPVQAW